MEEALWKFTHSGYCEVDDFFKKLNSLSHSVQSGYILFNQAVLNFHAGRFKEACETFKQLLSSGVFSCAECIQIVLALGEIYLLLAQPSKAYDMTSLMTETYKPDPNDKSGLVTLARLKNATLRAKVNIRKTESIDFDSSNIVVDCQKFSNWLNSFFQAQCLYRQGDFGVAGKFLNQADLALQFTSDAEFFRKFGYCKRCLQLNASACIFDRLNKPNLALLYFYKANRQRELVLGDALRLGNGKLPFYCRSQLIRLKLLHNQGISLLKAGQPTLAFECLVDVVASMRNNARLWLRLAECCIIVHNRSLALIHADNENKSLVQEIIGVGPHRKIVLRGFASFTKLSVETGAVPALSLEFAYSCLKNALAVLPDVDHTLIQADTDSVTVAPTLASTYPLPLCSNVSAKEILRIKGSLLCASAYVCLCLGENHAALQAAKSLLNLKSIITTDQKILGHLYAAEACIFLDRLGDALSYLKIDLPQQQQKTTSDQSLSPNESGATSTTVSASSGHTTSPSSVEQSVDLKSFKIVVYYNTAVAYALNKEFDKASQILALIIETVKDVPLQFPILQLYILLQKGQIEEARQAVFKTLRIPASATSRG